MYSSFKPPAGYYNDGTNYSAKGRWYQGDKVRFKGGFPEKMGGWVNSSGTTACVGICRNLHNWAAINGNRCLAIGTNAKYYVMIQNVLNDITPYITTVNLANNALSASNGSNIIQFTATAHGASVGDYFVLTGATGTFAGITATSLNAEWIITGVPDGNTIQFTQPTTATSTANGGGAGMTANFELSIGNVSRTLGAGYGAGAYGYGSYGGLAGSLALGNQPRIWSCDNFGQDLIINPRVSSSSESGNAQEGGIFYYTQGSSGRAVNISTLSGASDTPTAANYILVAPQSRQVFAFGCNPIGQAQDPMYIRWSDLESAAMWTPISTNSAGGFRLSLGSQIYCARNSSGQILVWTESSMHALQFIGGNLGWGQQVISPNIDIIGPNATATFGQIAMWMGKENFYLYDGTVKTMPCSVREYVFSNINYSQAWKVYAGVNNLHREIWWLYPSNVGIECDSYVVYNFEDDCWSFGTINRTAWEDGKVDTYPQAFSTDGFVYYHEVGLDDGSTTPSSPIDSWVESGPIEIDDGNEFTFLTRVMPDVTFAEASTAYPTVTFTVTPRDYPGGPYFAPDALPVTKVTSLPVEQTTQRLDMRMRGRHFVFRAESSGQLGTWWRLGTQRFFTQPDGDR